MVNYYQILLLAVALSLDAFSIAISLGIKCNNKKLEILFFLGVGICHFIFPYFGMLIGKTFLSVLIIYSSKILGIILLMLSCEMIYGLLTHKEEISYTHYSVVILIFTVSLDSFLTGIGLFNTKIKLFTLLSFSITSAFFSVVGIYIGKILQKNFAKYSSYISIIILAVLGVKYMFFN